MKVVESHAMDGRAVFLCVTRCVCVWILGIRRTPAQNVRALFISYRLPPFRQIARWDKKIAVGLFIDGSLADPEFAPIQAAECGILNEILSVAKFYHRAIV